MAFTFDEYKKLRLSGKSPEQIREMEKSGNNEKPLGGVVGAAAGFLGMKEFGQGIAKIDKTAINDTQKAQEGVVRQQDKVLAQIKTNRAAGKDSSRLEDALRTSTEGPDLAQEVMDVGTGGLTNKQVIGSALQTGLNVVGLRGGLPVGKTLVGKTAAGAASGAAFGAAEAIRTDKNVVKSTLSGAAVGGVVGGLLGVAQKAFTSATIKAPERLARSVLRQGRADLAAEAAGKKPVLAKQLLERGIKGSDESIVENSSTALARAERELQGLLERNPNTYIDVPTLNRSLDEIVRRKSNVFGSKGVAIVRDFKETLKAKGARISIAEANQLKRDIYKELSEAAFNADVLPTNKEVLRTMASALRESMGRTSKRISDLNAEQQFHIRVIDSLESHLHAKGKLNVLGLSDSIFAGAGIASGDPATAIGTGMIKRAVESTQFKTRAAIRLDQLGSAIEKIPTDTAGNVSKTALMDVLARVSSSVAGE